MSTGISWKIIMSYIVAFVRFWGSKRDYNVNCFRTDIAVNDSVLVRLGDGRYRPGKVVRLAYEDWNCKGALICRLNEAVNTPDGMMPGPDAVRIHGLVSWQQMAKHLSGNGWTRLDPMNRLIRALFARVNGNRRANIWLRTHGVDLQLIEGEKLKLPRPDAPRDAFLTEGRLVRHALALTTFNLYEGVARFAAAFDSGEEDLDRFFVAVGSTKRNENIPKAHDYDREDGNFEAMLYSALGGSGGSVYVGDGLYLGANGSWHSE